MNNYSKFQEALHKFALSSNTVKEATFDLEKILFLKHCNKNETDSVFVTGLARGGTTILLEAIYDSGSFASLSYNDMPFILAPNFWKRVHTKNTAGEKIERAHGDGIRVNLDSPEAFEEVFWKTFSLEKSEKYFADYINLILCKNNKNRYLSKNNQNVNRIDLITKIIPNAKFLIVYKEPIAHAYSLLNQHNRFSKAHKKDNFIKTYMDLIQHSEFGLSYQPIINENLKYQDTYSIEHWLEQWYLLYGKLFNKYQNNPNIEFVNGGSLHTGETWKNICEFIGIDHDFNGFKDMKKDITFDIEKELKSKCLDIYSSLLKKSL